MTQTTGSRTAWLKTAVQAIGLYFTCNGVFYAFVALVHPLLADLAMRMDPRWMEGMSRGNESYTMRMVSLPYTANAVGSLIVGGVLLCAPDLIVRAANGLSRSRDDGGAAAASGGDEAVG